MNTNLLAHTRVRSSASILLLAALIGSIPLYAADDKAPAKAVEQAGASKPAAGVLFNGKDLGGWKMRNEKADPTWKVVSQVALDPNDPNRLIGTGTGGGHDAVLFRAPVEHGTDIITEQSFGDCELHAEIMVAKGSNSGVYLMGRYEVQVFDSFGKPKDKITHADMGGFSSVQAPATNAAKAPGQWQTLDVVFRAPRFDAAGKKTENARFVRVTLNGEKVIEDLEVKGPTGGQISEEEKPTGPLMLQGDHGIVGYRNLTIKAR